MGPRAGERRGNSILGKDKLWHRLADADPALDMPMGRTWDVAPTHPPIAVTPPGDVRTTPKPTYADRGATRNRTTSWVLVAVIALFGAYTWGAHSIPPPPAIPNELTVGDMSKVCDTLRTYGADPAFSASCQTAAAAAVGDWTRQAVNDTQIKNSEPRP